MMLLLSSCTRCQRQCCFSIVCHMTVRPITSCYLCSTPTFHQSPTAVCFHTRGTTSQCRHLVRCSSFQLLRCIVSLHLTVGSRCSLRAVTATSNGSSHVIWRHRCDRGWWLNFWARRRGSNDRRARSTVCWAMATVGAITDGTRSDATVGNLLHAKEHSNKPTKRISLCSDARNSHYRAQRALAYEYTSM